MKLLYSIILGIIQGLGEFLPISSSGHLALAQDLLGLDVAENNLAFNVLLHLGTLLAVFIIYYKDIWEMVKAFFSLLNKVFHGNFKLSEYTVHERFVILLLIAVIPLVPAALLSDYVELISTMPIVVGAILILNGFLLFFSDKFAKGDKAMEDAIGVFGGQEAYDIKVLPMMTTGGWSVEDIRGEYKKVLAQKREDLTDLIGWFESASD
jgi:undecaprenyl-diphosphatase